MTEESPDHVAGLLMDWARGNERALASLVPLVYPELRRLAHSYLRSERHDHTMQSTDLVNEAFLRMLGGSRGELRNRAHFVALASRLMRQILVDHARGRQADKRAGGFRIDLEEVVNLPIKDDVQLLALDEALTELSSLDERQARIVEMKFFGGLRTLDIAQVLGVSLTTVEREWAVARLVLRRRMDATPSGP